MSGDLGYVVMFSFLFIDSLRLKYSYSNSIKSVSRHNNSVRTGIITNILLRHCLVHNNVGRIGSCLRDIATRKRVNQAIQSQVLMDANARETQGISSPTRQDVTSIATKKDQVDILTMENAGKGVTKIMRRLLELASLQQS